MALSFSHQAGASSTVNECQNRRDAVIAVHVVDTLRSIFLFYTCGSNEQGALASWTANRDGPRVVSISGFRNANNRNARSQACEKMPTEAWPTVGVEPNVAVDHNRADLIIEVRDYRQ